MDIDALERMGGTDNFTVTKATAHDATNFRSKKALFRYVKNMRTRAFLAIARPMHSPPMFQEA